MKTNHILWIGQQTAINRSFEDSSSVNGHERNRGRDQPRFTFNTIFAAKKQTLTMFIIIGIMLTGMLLGYLLRSKRLSWIHKIITLFIWILLFLLGIDVGGNDSIIKGLHTLGLEAVIITIAAVIGSILCAWGLWYLLYIKNRGKETKA